MRLRNSYFGCPPPAPGLPPLEGAGALGALPVLPWKDPPEDEGELAEKLERDGGAAEKLDREVGDTGIAPLLGRPSNEGEAGRFTATGAVGR